MRSGSALQEPSNGLPVHCPLFSQVHCTQTQTAHIHSTLSIRDWMCAVFWPKCCAFGGGGCAVESLPFSRYLLTADCVSAYMGRLDSWGPFGEKQNQEKVKTAGDYPCHSPGIQFHCCSQKGEGGWGVKLSNAKRRKKTCSPAFERLASGGSVASQRRAGPFP